MLYILQNEDLIKNKWRGELNIIILFFNTSCKVKIYNYIQELPIKVLLEL